MAKPIPDGYHSLTPNLIVGDGKKAIDFYKKALGAKEISTMRCPESGKVLHSELEIGDSRFMLGEEMAERGCFSPRHYRGTPVSMYLYVKDCDRIFDQAVKAGANPVMPVADMFWGDRCGTLKDPFGHQWSIATHKNDLTVDEVKDAMRQWMTQTEKTLVTA